MEVKIILLLCFFVTTFFATRNFLWTITGRKVKSKLYTWIRHVRHIKTNITPEAALEIAKTEYQKNKTQNIYPLFVEDQFYHYRVVTNTFFYRCQRGEYMKISVMDGKISFSKDGY